MDKVKLMCSYNYIISVENLLAAWQEFVRGKRHRRDVQVFALNLMNNIIQLHNDLANFTYRHSPYQAFNISDPKPRNIHKASVRDRLLHHAIYRVLYPFFDRTFISDSYSCRLGKGTHRAINKFREYAYKVSKNNTKTGWVLKGDIKKFFASIDHTILKNILFQYIPDKNIIWLLNRVIDSFEVRTNKGLPLGNLTSQLLVNICMNTFDQFVKHKLKAKYYIRYADDFVILSDNRDYLSDIVRAIRNYLKDRLALEIHPRKMFLSSLASGIDYLGYIHFSSYRILRTKTKRRVLRMVSQKNLSSYLGICRYANTFRLQQKLWSRVFIANFSKIQ